MFNRIDSTNNCVLIPPRSTVRERNPSSLISFPTVHRRTLVAFPVRLVVLSPLLVLLYMNVFKHSQILIIINKYQTMYISPDCPSSRSPINKKLLYTRRPHAHNLTFHGRHICSPSILNFSLPSHRFLLDQRQVDSSNAMLPPTVVETVYSRQFGR
jgi:hypothetical protein